MFFTPKYIDNDFIKNDTIIEEKRFNLFYKEGQKERYCRIFY